MRLTFTPLYLAERGNMCSLCINAVACRGHRALKYVVFYRSANHGAQVEAGAGSCRAKSSCGLQGQHEGKELLL